MTKRLFAGAILGAALIAAPAFAQQPPGTPVMLRGTIDSIDGNTLAMTTTGGEKLNVTLAEQLRVGYNAQRTMADLDEGVQLGVTTVEGEDGKPRAIEVHIMDQTPGVHRPWDEEAGSTMTNGEVTTITDTAADGSRMMTVHYKTDQAEGDYEILVPGDIPVVHLSNDGDRSLLVPGAYIFVSGRKLDDGTYTAGYIQAEKDGVKPPL